MAEEQKLSEFDLDRAIETLRQFQIHTKAAIIAAARAQMNSPDFWLEMLINHHYKATQFAHRSQIYLEYLKSKLQAE